MCVCVCVGQLPYTHVLAIPTQCISNESENTQYKTCNMLIVKQEALHVFALV